MQTFSFGNLDELDTGQLITRLTNDVTQVQEAIVMILRMLVRAPLLLVGSLIMAITTSPQLAFLPLVLMPFELAAVIWIVNKATPMFTRVQERLDTLNGVMQENLAGVRVVKAFVRAVYEEARFGKANVNLTNQTVQAARAVAIMPPFMMVTINLGIIGVLWFGGRHVVQGTHAGRANHCLRQLPDHHPVFADDGQHDGDPAGTRRSLGQTHPGSPRERTRSAGSSRTRRSRSNITGQVAFENVTFSYNGNSGDAVLKGVSFTAEPGQTVAILGTTGAGKSSLVHLIPRFYDVKSGRVTIDGIDVRELDQETLRRRIGIALQEVVLFSGNIRDNIRYGRPEATDEEVIAAAKAAQAHEFILSFPEGYDTQLGQRGVNLSGGQKQRIAIARALLLEPSILILDDSTSAVDVETESKIQEALEAIMNKRTSFRHRPADQHGAECRQNPRAG